MADTLDQLKEKSVMAHRILTQNHSMGDQTGHVFVRTPEGNDFLARCRNQTDTSPGYVEAKALHRIDFDGIPTEDTEDWTIPPERHIATQIFKTRPEVNCVIHAHPPAQVLCANAGIPLRPIVGAQNGGGAQLARLGIGVYGRSLLIHNPQISQSMLAVMGRKDVVLLKGHGNVVCGRSIEEATVRAIQIENLARLTWQIALSGRFAPEVPFEDIEDAIASRGTTQGNAGGVNWVWEYYKKMYEQERRLSDVIE